MLKRPSQTAKFPDSKEEGQDEDLLQSHPQRLPSSLLFFTELLAQKLKAFIFLRRVLGSPKNQE
jgi:hypothetical protein